MSRRWTELERRFLIANSGRMSTKQIAIALDRSEESVSVMASRLRSSGVLKTTLRRYKTRSHECPSCHSQRMLFTKDGICKVCHQEEHIEEYREKLSSVYDMLPEWRKDGLSTEISTQVFEKNDPMPKESDFTVTYVDYDAYNKAVDNSLEERELRELSALNREWDALRRKKKTWSGWIDEDSKK